MRIHALLSLVAFVMLNGCATSTIMIASSDVAYGLRLRTETVRVDLECPENATVLDAAVDLRSAAGRAEFRLRDPSGKVIWRVVASGGHAHQQGELPAVAGRWQGELVLDAFSGDYEVELAAHEWPDLDVRVEVTDVRVVPAGSADGGGDDADPERGPRDR